jgi:aminoglycoside 6'-N-acetyltransferase I
VVKVIKKIAIADQDNHNDIKRLLMEAFPWSYENESVVQEELNELLSEDYLLYGYLLDGCVIGVVGARPAYGKTGFELHPMAVARGFQKRGIGKLLLEHVEHEAEKLGCITMFLGTDDEHFRTSLSEENLYENFMESIKNIKNYKDHPYTFYEKQGYIIVGVIPDANGYNKPDIMMAKSLRKKV